MCGKNLGYRSGIAKLIDMVATAWLLYLSSIQKHLIPSSRFLVLLDIVGRLETGNPNLRSGCWRSRRSILSCR
jgi:hypothetical protein